MKNPYVQVRTQSGKYLLCKLITRRSYNLYEAIGGEYDTQREVQLTENNLMGRCDDPMLRFISQHRAEIKQLLGVN